VILCSTLALPSGASKIPPPLRLANMCPGRWRRLDQRWLLPSLSRYPRELSARDADEEALAAPIASWLQVLGRNRMWWRDLGGGRGSGGGCNGITNFGNTCFFSATVQVWLSGVASQQCVPGAASTP
jgi:hypothetical protein